MLSGILSLCSSRLQGEDAVANMTRSAYSHYVRGYFEKDRLVFSTLLAFEASLLIFYECQILALHHTQRHPYTCMVSVFLLPLPQLEVSNGRASRSEVEFLLCPSPGSQFAVRGLAAQACDPAATSKLPPVGFGKKPFDWLAETQWQMLLVSGFLT